MRGVHGGGGGVTIHLPLPAVITFTSELRLTYRLRLREALSVLFDSIPLVRYRFKLERLAKCSFGFCKV
ncbi:hypothetical protein PIB30_017345 [Stylosanthes scabra]|uniref:Uncharacterized protein n=1 Tax=Stylosanthes scabra TaxID=79078 RepID=A0ABU6T8S1_9FABA|nr:hypothetical protein [Stylosanthes scabra]